MKKLAIFIIELYQKYISPYKGFSCAYRVATGEVGCSGYGKKVISRYGVSKGYALLKRRFYDCKCCSEELKKSQKPKQHINYGMNLQKGFCDVDCGGCDLPSCDIPSCDLPSCDLPDCGSLDFPDCKTPSFGGFGIDDFCDCCDFGDSKGNNQFNEEKRKEKVQRKMEKKKGKVSLEKDEINDSDNES